MKRRNRARHCNRGQLLLRLCRLRAIPLGGRGVIYCTNSLLMDAQVILLGTVQLCPEAAALCMQLRPLPGFLHRRRWRGRGGPPRTAAQGLPHPVPPELFRVVSHLPSPLGFPSRRLERQWLALSPGEITSLLLAK